ncbi:MAG: TraB/GumN family protein [Syntrophorhabdus sp.]
MKDIRRAFFVLFIVIFVAALPRVSFAAEKHFLWRVENGASRIYLLGSIHFMKPESYPLDPAITAVFDTCDSLAVEADINNVPGSIIQKLRSTGFYTPPDSIANHVSPETYGYIQTESARLGFPVAAIASQRPWLLGITLSSVVLIRSGYIPDYGLDRYFLNQAAGKKNIFELESLDYQIDLLANLPDREQEAFLLYTIKDLTSLVRQVDVILTAWRTGDAAAIESMLGNSVENDDNIKKVYRKTMTDRNGNMAKKIAGYLNSGKRVFVVVGAGHMVGHDGIIELLKKAGFIVEQL